MSENQNTSPDNSSEKAAGFDNFISKLTDDTAREAALTNLNRRMRGYDRIAQDHLDELEARPSTLYQELMADRLDDYVQVTNMSSSADLSTLSTNEALSVDQLKGGFYSIADYFRMVRHSKLSEESILGQVHGAHASLGHLLQTHMAERCSELKITGKAKISKFFHDLADARFYYVQGDFICFDKLNTPCATADVASCSFDPKTQSLTFSYRLVRVTDVRRARDFTAIVKKHVDEVTTTGGTFTVIKGIKDGKMELLDDIKLSSAKMPLQCFYPTITMPLADYWREFMNASANLIIVIGPYGTGKSTFIRGGVHALGLSALATANQSLMMNSSFITECGTRMSGAEGKYDLLIAEEAEKLVQPKVSPDPTVQPDNLLMPTLLDALDGISKVNSFKMAIVLNSSDLSNIEPGLMRPERCFDVVHLGHLTAEESAEVRKQLGRPPRQYKPNGQFVLAEVVSEQNHGINHDTVTGAVTIKPRFGIRDLNKRK